VFNFIKKSKIFKFKYERKLNNYYKLKIINVRILKSNLFKYSAKVYFMIIFNFNIFLYKISFNKITNIIEDLFRKSQLPNLIELELNLR